MSVRAKEASSSSQSLRRPPGDERIPAVDERAVRPETRTEMIHGKLFVTPPADEAHATTHMGLAALLRAHLAPGYKAAVDMLTRTSETNDFAPAASVFLEARDPATGGRHLEELAFEIVSKLPLARSTTKARELIRRGVRRVFCLHLKENQVLEWSRDIDTWTPLPHDVLIEDRCFIRPLPALALHDPVALDFALNAALTARRESMPIALREEAYTTNFKVGLAQGLREGLLRILKIRHLAVSRGDRSKIERCAEPDVLDRWLKRAVNATSIADVLKA